METTCGETTRYVIGHSLLIEYDDLNRTYLIDGGQGSVRQMGDGGDQVTLAKGHRAFGVTLWIAGSGLIGALDLTHCLLIIGRHGAVV